MSVLRIPTIPNSPLESREDNQVFGLMQLRRNRALDFIENGAFDPSLATYDANYQNSQAHSPLFQRHMEAVLKRLKRQFPAKSRMVEVGCGKGSFLELVQADGYFDVTGYDATYEGSSPLIEKRYLGADDRLEADIVVLRHVLEHIQAPHRFLAMLKDVFGPAKIYIEVPNYDWITENQAFFDITYEHVNYFSMASLQALFDEPTMDHGICFGDQYQYIIADIASLSDRFFEVYEGDQWENLVFDALFPDLAAKISDIETQLSGDGKLYVWGAATKGCMFLVHCANQGRLLNRVGFAVDVNPHKCGKFLPGSLIPIKHKEAFFAQAKPTDVLLISNPNYGDEILAEPGFRALDGLRVIML